MSDVILDIAKQAICDEFERTSTIDHASLLRDFTFLGAPKATFVTLHLEGALRGCIGSLIAHRSLLEDLIHNAKAAAFEDPRFYPLSQEEFQRVCIEVSLLTDPEEIIYIDKEDLLSKVTTGVDGIILQKGDRKATFLPQVWEQLPTFEQFFSHLCQKAGLEASCLDAHPTIWRYRVEKVG